MTVRQRDTLAKAVCRVFEYHDLLNRELRPHVCPGYAPLHIDVHAIAGSHTTLQVNEGS